MSDKQVIIHSPVAEDSAAMSAQINDTVKMTSYQVKRKLKTEMGQVKQTYNNLNAHIEKELGPKFEEIVERINAEAKEILIPQIVEKLDTLSDWIEVGEGGTYFDDNRSTEVALELIAESILNIQKVELKEEHAEVQISIGILGATKYSEYSDVVEREDTTFTPATQTKQFQLTAEEVEHVATMKAREAEKLEANKQYNALDLQLQNLNSLSEDIEYALLKEKHSATATSDLVNQLTEAITSGNTSPDFLLNKD